MEIDLFGEDIKILFHLDY